MRSVCLAGSALALTMLLAGCSDAPPPTPPDTTAADQKAIRDGEAAWNGEWAARDADKIVSHYADNASLLLTNMPALRGKNAIMSGTKEFLADKNLTLTFTNSSVNVAKSGDVAWSEGTYALTQTDMKSKKVIAEKGKYVTVYKKQTDGVWKAEADITNPDAPPAPVAGAKAAKKTPAAVHKKKKK